MSFCCTIYCKRLQCERLKYLSYIIMSFSAWINQGISACDLSEYNQGNEGFGGCSR